MTRSMDNLQQEGPLLDVYFSLPEGLEKKLKAEGKQVPAPIHCKALIDTGASNCVVQEEIPTKLNLNPTGETTITTPSCESCKCYTYYMRLTIPVNKIIIETIFTAAPLKNQEIDCLFGRDALSNCVFIYIGYAGQFTLSV